MTKKLNLAQFLPYRCNNLAEQISFSLSRIYVERFGVSVAQWRILATLGDGSEMQAKEIGRVTNMDKVRVSRAVTSLRSRGLLERKPCDTDSRAALLSLSSEGQHLYRRIAPEALRWEEQLLQPLSHAERQSLFGMIEKLETRLGEMEASA
ncbi:MAG: MarR family transcriptional regulator [Halioglobus sp.]